MNVKNYIVIIIASHLIHQVTSEQCGVTKFNDGLVVGGQVAKRGQWPFMTALFNVETQCFFCGGTLVTQKHVLTAAHCIQQKYSSLKLTADELVIFLGRHNLSVPYELNSDSIKAAEIIVHSDWKINTDKYDADIAIVVLRQPVVISNFVRLACIPSDNSENIFEYSQGYVVGWGRTENSDINSQTNEGPIKHVAIRVVTNEFCFLDTPELTELASNKTFCAGGQKTGACHGDSGGGFFINSGSSWTLRGIVSSSFIEDGRCDVSRYSIYTNVVKFLDWIIKITGVTQQVIGITLNCEFRRLGSSFPKQYQCVTQNLVVTQGNFKITGTSETHLTGCTNSNVEALNMNDEIVNYLPNGIGSIFPNLVILQVEKAQLKSIVYQNFKKLNKLKQLWLRDNQIKNFPEDTLDDLSSLEIILLSNNQITELVPSIFTNLINLREFYMGFNKLTILDKDLFRNSTRLKSVSFYKNEIDQIYINFLNFSNIRRIDLQGNICTNLQYGSGPSAQNVHSVEDLMEEINSNCQKDKTLQVYK